MPLPATTTGGYTIRTCFPENADAISYVVLLNAYLLILECVSRCKLHGFSLQTSLFQP